MFVSPSLKFTGITVGSLSPKSTWDNQQGAYIAFQLDGKDLERYRDLFPIKPEDEKIAIEFTKHNPQEFPEVLYDNQRKRLDPAQIRDVYYLNSQQAPRFKQLLQEVSASFEAAAVRLKQALPTGIKLIDEPVQKMVEEKLLALQQLIGYTEF